ncbi:hypothetical protein [Paenibacillus lutrae]|uniref:Uncharacterized protein n=1 Tax=Paenibacillus lutrae TaxID=2078573 RepID=A0A7X3FEU7_9BACL|nr:hypothetical protein [Paenibacillus lutrae]MVO98186.1 hypothetical protein [Paenibacillus lutrae]
MSVRYPLNFLFFIAVFTLAYFYIDVDPVWGIVIGTLVLIALDYIMDRSGVSQIKIPVYMGVLAMIIIVVLLVLIT